MFFYCIILVVSSIAIHHLVEIMKLPLPSEIGVGCLVIICMLFLLLIMLPKDIILKIKRLVIK